jgi:hypothetical protein
MAEPMPKKLPRERPTFKRTCQAEGYVINGAANY